MDDIQIRVEQVRRESQRLSEFLDNLPGGAWETQSACERWSVGDVVAHLASGAEFYAEQVSRGLQGDPKHLPGYPVPGEMDPQELGNLNANRTVFRRAGLGNRLLPTFKSTNQRFNQLFASLNPEDWDKPCYHPWGETPARGFVSLRMFELALHGWDIASRLEPTASLPDESLPMVLEWVVAMCPDLLRLPSGYPSGDRIRFRLQGPSASEYDLLMEEGGARMAPAQGPAPGAVFRCGESDFALIMTGRLRVETALEDSRLTIEDGRWLPPDFGDWFQGVWRPRD